MRKGTASELRDRAVTWGREVAMAAGLKGVAFTGEALKSLTGSPEPDGPEEDEFTEASAAGRWVGRALRAVMILAAVSVLATYLGYVVVDRVNESASLDWAQKLNLGAGVISMTLLATALQQILLSVYTMWGYIRGGSGEALFSAYVKLGTTAFILAITVFAGKAYLEDQPLSPQPPVLAAVSAAPVYLARTPPRPGRLATFPIHFSENAIGPKDGWRAGVSIEEGHVEPLRRLIAGLAGCVDAGESGRVTLSVSGFSSSAEFHSGGVQVANTDALNLEAANRRARAVADWLAEQKANAGLGDELSIELHRWPTIEAMRGSRRYEDRPQQSGDYPQEFFTRIVEIDMKRAGRCERLAPS